MQDASENMEQTLTGGGTVYQNNSIKECMVVNKMQQHQKVHNVETEETSKNTRSTSKLQEEI